MIHACTRTYPILVSIYINHRHKPFHCRLGARVPLIMRCAINIAPVSIEMAKVACSQLERTLVGALVAAPVLGRGCARVDKDTKWMGESCRVRWRRYHLLLAVAQQQALWIHPFSMLFAVVHNFQPCNAVVPNRRR